ncbi:Histone acetyltransferase type B catalytic subuni t [Trichuris trichiura]|uniref:Histone acetyltransferase type B catalytic subunit n=1 Tax=Trichuris trichiura TaxID=36087 RepID=A0A077Z847_TRITR|nr:Histone acetyltransferase type B catalytic subuni t [Trichuris trichiura]
MAAGITLRKRMEAIAGALKKRRALSKEPTYTRKDYESFMVPTEGLITVAMVSNYDDFSTSPCGFAANYSYQIFESEKIFGYKKLSLMLMFAVADFQIFPRVTADEIVPKKMGKPDDLVAIVQRFLELPVCQSELEFRQVLANQSAFKPFGQKIAAYEKRGGSDVREFEVYNVTEMSEAFAAYIRRLQFAAALFIEGLSFTDATDKKWEYYILHEKCVGPGGTYYATLGFCSVYNFYMYPDYVKPRIAQFIIMPQYQLCGHGTRFLQEILMDLASRKSVWHVTVESPNAAFCRIYDVVEATNCSYLASFAPEHLKNGFSVEMKDEAFSVFKMSKERARRAYEALRLVQIRRDNGRDVDDFDMELKRRVYANIRACTADRVDDDEICSTDDEPDCSLSGEVDCMRDERTMFKERYMALLESYLGVVVRLEDSERFLPMPKVLQHQE